MRLHDYPASANCLKVRLLLAQLGIPYERTEVDIFAGASSAPEYLALNPAGRTPVLQLDSGEALAESNAILLFLGGGTALLPDDPLEQARVHQWLFFEQNLLEPNVGTARFWALTGRREARPEAFTRHLEAGRAALAVLERHLARSRFLANGRYSVADVSSYAYAHVAHEAGIEMVEYPSLRAWLARVEAEAGFVNDLEPYPPNAAPGSGSVHG
ncbi:MAG: glutathione S-transferase family protein [Gaiellaceae bacterium]